jgi:alpha-N-arabinofuranosidase
MVALGFRPIDNKYKNLGRETFLIPVVWETEPYWWKDEKVSWPVCSPKTGKVEFEYSVPFPRTKQVNINNFYDSFDHPKLNVEWNFRRTPTSSFHSLNEKIGSLRLYLKKGFISEQGQYSFVGIRQRHFQMEAKTKMECNLSDEEEAGITVIQNDRSAYVMSLMDGEIQLHHFFHGTDSLLASHSYKNSTVFFNISSDYLDYDFSYSQDGNSWVSLFNNADGSKLSPESSGWTYTGVYVGLYGSSNGSTSSNYADFDWFQYKGFSE